MVIPPQAKLVFRGKIFKVYQWEQKMYDGTTEIFEALKRPGTVQVLATRENKILMSYEEQPLKSRGYNFLGGRVEEGEDPLEAAKRELLEEAGVTSDQWSLYKIYKAYGKTEWSTYFYIAKNCEKVAPQKLDGGEKIEIQEVNFKEFLTIVSDESFWNITIANDILRMRLDAKKLEQFKQKIFS